LSSVLFRIRYLFPPGALLLSLAFALTIAVAASLGPAWAAARLSPIETLRYE